MERSRARCQPTSRRVAAGLVAVLTIGLAAGLAAGLVACGGEPSPGGSATEESSAEPGEATSDALPSDVVIGTTSDLFGFLICSPRPLHACVARTNVRHGVRLYPQTDIAANARCEGQRQAAEARCPALDSEPRRERCLLAQGILLDAFADYEEGHEPGPQSRFTLDCREGHASIDFIEPF